MPKQATILVVMIPIHTRDTPMIGLIGKIDF